MSQGPLAAIHDERLVELTGAHLATVRRWKRRPRIPRWLARLVRVCVQGELDDIDRAWRGWKIRGGMLVSPEGATYTPGAVRAGELWKSRALALGALDRRARHNRDTDPVNNAKLDRLAALHRALEQAGEAFEELTSGLSGTERNRIYCSSPGATPTRPRLVVGGNTAQNSVGASLRLQLVDTGVSAIDGTQNLVELAAHPRRETADHEGRADEFDYEALGKAHDCEAR